MSAHSEALTGTDEVTTDSGGPTMAMGKVQTEESGSLPGLIVVTVSGEVDLAMAPAMDSNLSAALGQGQDIVVDLSDATFLDSVALGVLTWALEASQEAGRRLFLIISDQRVLRVFELTGLTGSFAIFDTRADLIERLSQADSTT
jgi:anti-sigma B factor antagonist